MRRQEAMDRLKRVQPDLRRQGLSVLRLFGSVARDEAREDLDVDVAFTVPNDVRFSFFDQAGILNELSERLGLPVDFVELDDFRPRIRARVETELVQVF